MTTTRTASIEPIPTDYDDLVRLHVPRPIHDDVGLENATEIVDRLAVLDSPTKDQADYLDLLTMTIDAYEADKVNLELARRNPIKILRFLLAENNMSGSDLGRLLGNRTLGHAILRGKRQLSKTHIKRLAKRFKVDAGLFLS